MKNGKLTDYEKQDVPRYYKPSDVGKYLLEDQKTPYRIHYGYGKQAKAGCS